MQVTVDLPDDILEALKGQWADLQRQMVEAIAIEGYRTGALNENQVRRVLGFHSRFDVHAFLKEHRVPLRYVKEDIDEDLRAHRDAGILGNR